MEWVFFIKKNFFSSKSIDFIRFIFPNSIIFSNFATFYIHYNVEFGQRITN